MPDPSDRDLALRARRGDPRPDGPVGPVGAEAFGELVRRYQTPVFNVCLRLLGGRAEAEDLAQEAFIRAFQRFNTYDVERPFGPWVRRVAANLCLNHLAQARPPALALDDERDEPPAPALSQPEALREHAEEAEGLRAAILALPPQYRVIIELRHFQDMSYDEIAATLGLPLSDVKSHLFRARKLLAESLKRDDG